MQQFDYNKYLKNNPLLKEGDIPTRQLTGDEDADWMGEAKDKEKDIEVDIDSADQITLKGKELDSDKLGTNKKYRDIILKAPDKAFMYKGKPASITAVDLNDGSVDEPKIYLTIINEAIGQENNYKKAALELVTLAKNLISRAGESLVMNSEVKKASMITDEDGLSELYYHLQDVLGELIGSEARAFTREAKKIIVDKYGITMTDESGFPMKWVKEGINESTKIAQTLKSTKPGDKLTLVLDDNSTATVVRVGTDKRGEPTFKHIKNNKEVGTASALSASHIKSIKSAK